MWLQLTVEEKVYDIPLMTIGHSSFFHIDGPVKTNPKHYTRQEITSTIFELFINDNTHLFPNIVGLMLLLHYRVNIGIDQVPGIFAHENNDGFKEYYRHERDSSIEVSPFCLETFLDNESAESSKRFELDVNDGGKALEVWTFIEQEKVDKVKSSVSEKLKSRTDLQKIVLGEEPKLSYGKHVKLRNDFELLMWRSCPFTKKKEAQLFDMYCVAVGFCMKQFTFGEFAEDTDAGGHFIAQVRQDGLTTFHQLELIIDTVIAMVLSNPKKAALAAGLTIAARKKFKN